VIGPDDENNIPTQNDDVDNQEQSAISTQEHMSRAREKVHAEPAKSRYSQIIRPKTIMIKICDARTMKSQNLTLCSIIEDCNVSLNVEP